MPTYTPDDDDEDDGSEDSGSEDDSVAGEHLRSSELPDDADTDGEDGDVGGGTVPCPYCGKPVYDFADVCPHCHSFVSLDAVPDRRPRWVLIGVLVCLAVVLFGWVLRGIIGL